MCPLQKMLGLCLIALACGQSCPDPGSELDRGGYRPKMLIGIGAQKCGSSFIYQSIRAHPQVIPAKQKELREFIPADYNATQEAYEKYLEKWDTLSNLKQFPEERVLFEFTPSYMHVPTAPCHIKHFFPDAKFLVTLRDPVYRVLSALNMGRNRCYKEKEEEPTCKNQFATEKRRIGALNSTKWLTCSEWFGDILPKFEETIQLLHDNKQCLDAFSEDPWVDCPIAELFVIGRSLYAPQLSRWLKLFDKSQFLFINAREMFLDPESQWRKIIKFAGLSEDWSPLPPTKHANDLLFVDENLDEIVVLLKSILDPVSRDLYKLLQDKGIDFTPLEPEAYAKNRTTVSTSRVLSYCAAEGVARVEAGKFRRELVESSRAGIHFGDQYLFILTIAGYVGLTYFLWIKLTR